MPYFDLHQHLKNLEEHGLLRRVTQADQQRHGAASVGALAVSRLSEEDRKAWLFENVTDAKGKRYTMPVVVGALAGKPEIYYLGMGCNSAEEMDARLEESLGGTGQSGHRDQGEMPGRGHSRRLSWTNKAMASTGFRCRFRRRDSTTGRTQLALTGSPRISIPGFRTSAIIVARSKPAGASACSRPVSARIFICTGKKAVEKGQHLPAALVIGAPPIVSYVSVQKIPYGVDEMGVAGGLAGEPIPMVKCKTHRHYGAGGRRDRRSKAISIRNTSSPKDRSASRTATCTRGS